MKLITSMVAGALLVITPLLSSAAGLLPSSCTIENAQSTSMVSPDLQEELENQQTCLLNILNNYSERPFILLNEYFGYPGQQLVVSGFHFNPQESVTIGLFDNAGASSASTNVVADAEGQFINIPVHVPQSSVLPVVITAQGKTSTSTAATPFFTNRSSSSGFYPVAKPTSHYVAPNQTFGITGSGFAPFEVVSLVRDTTQTVGTYMTDQSGRLNIPQAFHVPWNYGNSTHTFTLLGNKSAYSIPLKITVGSFYPNIEPSSYYVNSNQAVLVSGKGFAPNETVVLKVNGIVADQEVTSASGEVSLQFAVPLSGTTVTITGVGLLSGVSSTRTLTIAQ